MDTNRLKRFATEARNILMQGVAHRFTALGFLPDGTVTEEPQPLGGGATFMGDTVSEDFYKKWCSLQRAVNNHSIEEVAEEAAYTWFNRMVAIRIMVKNGLIAPVLQYESDGVHIPLLVTEARQGRMPEMTIDDQRKLEDLLLDDSKTDEQFRILIVAFCHTNPVINSCFGHISDYTELLLPTNILAEGGFVDMLNNTEFISEEDYHSPELIGWLYQFYISEKKDDVFASFKKGNKAEAKDIPAATQIFTPNWIVKYMVQNTIGRIYLDNNPYEEDIQKNWKYLVEPTEKTLKENILHYDDLKELKFADLASGSGHILNECFDILYDLYILEGYSRKDAIENIFHYNLTGVDIDTRAKQLAQFALLLKACQKDSGFADAHIMPRVLDMPEPYPFKDNLYDVLPQFFLGGNQEMIQEVCDAIKLMDDAKNLGSIMKFNISEKTRNAIMVRLEDYEDEAYVSESVKLLLPYMQIIFALTESYSALVMNPPYMGNRNMNAELKEYVNNNYEDGKADLCTAFMILQGERTAVNGLYANIIPPSWLFLSTFESLRQYIIDNQSIQSLLHLSRGVFGADFGSVSCVIKNNIIPNSKGTYFKLVERTFQEFEQKHLQILFEKVLDNHLFRFKFTSYSKDMTIFDNSEDGSQIYFPHISQSIFKKIPGEPFAYWLNDNIMEAYSKSPSYKFIDFKTGITTGDNPRFTRLWMEVDPKNNTYWKFLRSGATYRKWYGCLLDVIYWKDDGALIKSMPNSTMRNPEYMYKPAITWSKISSGDVTVRFSPQEILFDAVGLCGFADKETQLYGMALYNSRVGNFFIRITNASMSILTSDLGKIPFIKSDMNKICTIAEENISICRNDWDAHEISWDFQRNELLNMDSETMLSNIERYSELHYKKTGEHILIDPVSPEPNKIAWCYQTYIDKWKLLLFQLQENEFELNKKFIEIYGLQNELSPDIPLEEITILQQGEITIENNQLKWNADIIMKQLISYAIGCMMGRYSIDKHGLILASQGDGLEQYKERVPDSRFEPDDDGIIPLMSAQCDFSDNATIRFKQWLVSTFGEDTLVENLNFIEKCLGKSIDDYFVKDFWKDHKKMYQNRPIYWLFSSKKGAFQCLTYMHRMDAYTAERIRTKYLLPHIEWLIQKQGDMEANAANLNARERKELDNIGKQIDECREYHDRLHVFADKQIAFDLDDGVVVNYAKFGDVLCKLK